MLDYIAIIYSGPLREYSEVTNTSPRLHGSQNELRVLEFRVEGSGDYIVLNLGTPPTFPDHVPVFFYKLSEG